MSATVKKVRVSADWKERKDGSRVPGAFVTMWRVLVDGKMVDSFLDETKAEQKAAALNRASGAAE